MLASIPYSSNVCDSERMYSLYEDNSEPTPVQSRTWTQVANDVMNSQAWCSTMGRVSALVSIPFFVLAAALNLVRTAVLAAICPFSYLATWGSANETAFSVSKVAKELFASLAIAVVLPVISIIVAVISLEPDSSSPFLESLELCTVPFTTGIDAQFKKRTH